MAFLSKKFIGEIENKSDKKNDEIIVNELKEDDLLNIAGGINYSPEESAEIEKTIFKLKSFKVTDI